jgi:hypothetical protein
MSLMILSWWFASAASACNIPVFRYALERWHNTQEEDRYQVVLFHRGPLTAEDAKLAALLRDASEGRDSLANLSMQTIDLAGTAEESWQELWGKQKDASLPWLVLRSPSSSGERTTVWSGPLQAETVSALLDSPVRREIARSLMQGVSVVWLLLESGDKERDDNAAAMLQTQLRRLEKSVRFPDATGDESAKLLSNLPLRLVFSTVRVRQTDPAEKILVATLRHADSDLNSTEPMVFPVFGRGRVLDALVGEDLNADTLQDAARFLCGACSCLVKRLNPGFDLLIAADWDAVLEDREVVQPRLPTCKGERVPIPSPKQPTEDADEAALTSTRNEEPERPVSARTLMLAMASVASLLTAGVAVLVWWSHTRK